ncbi:hypothetical protein AZ002_004362, partial [Citrobacter freundii]
FTVADHCRRQSSTVKIRIRICGTVWCQPGPRFFWKNEPLPT